MLIIKITKTLKLEKHKDYDGVKFYHRYTPKSQWKSFYLSDKEIKDLYKLLFSFVNGEKE